MKIKHFARFSLFPLLLSVSGSLPAVDPVKIVYEKLNGVQIGRTGYQIEGGQITPAPVLLDAQGSSNAQLGGFSLDAAALVPNELFRIKMVFGAAPVSLMKIESKKVSIEGQWVDRSIRNYQSKNIPVVISLYRKDWETSEVSVEKITVKAEGYFSSSWDYFLHQHATGSIRFQFPRKKKDGTIVYSEAEVQLSGKTEMGTNSRKSSARSNQ